MTNSILWISKTANELRAERDLAIKYLRRISEPDPPKGFINRRLLALEALELLEVEPSDDQR